MKGIVSWFASNGVAANLLMAAIVGAGVFSLSNLKMEVFPEFSLDVITIRVPYLGAAPEEVEEGVCIKIEEAIQGLAGVERVTSNAREGVGIVSIDVAAGHNVAEVLDNVKSRVDGIDTFPLEAEKPVIRERTGRWQVISVSISGLTDELTLRRIGEQIRDELLALPQISQAELVNTRPYEISIEISEDALRRHGLTFDFIAGAIRRASIDLPGGSVKTEGGEILLRTNGQAYEGRQFGELTLLTRPDGTRLLLRDVARIVDGFKDTDQRARLDGQPTVMVQVFRVGEESVLEVAAAVYDYVEHAKQRLPDGITLSTWQDGSRILRSRIDLLVRNGLSGLLLVFIVLALFLKLRLAFWVTLGVPVAFLGAIGTMPWLDVSINMISLFSFILVLGIIVDDAIVVADSVYIEQEKQKHGLGGAILGVQAVSVPVVFGVLTTIAAFAPMLYISGLLGKIFRVFPLIIIPALLFSLIESHLILPNHLSHRSAEMPSKRRNLLSRAWDGFFGLVSATMNWFIRRIYEPILVAALEWRYLTISIALVVLLVTVGFVPGGVVEFILFPRVESDNVAAFVTMPEESPVELTAGAVRQLEQAAIELRRRLESETGDDVYRHVLASIGEHPFRMVQRGPIRGGPSLTGAHLGEVNIELAPSESRDISAQVIADRWRALTGPIPNVVELSFTSDLIGGDKPIDIQLSGVDLERVASASERIEAELAAFPGVIDISDSFRQGKPEIKLAITSKGEALGLSLRDLGRQVRQGFFGEEAQRLQRGPDDVRVMVRYPAEDRRSLGDIEQMRVRTPSGGEVPFSTVAAATLGRGFTNIKRVDRNRSINVTAEVDESTANTQNVLSDLEEAVLPRLMADYPDVTYSFEGDSRQWVESMQGLTRGFVAALLIMFALLAIPLKSYIQPLIVLSAIPFGIVGAVWGHLTMGMPLSILSMCGVLALAGLVVNDSLVLVSYINSHRSEGMPLFQAVREAGVVRFRPILLTSLTTVAGVTPLILEKSVQAQFLIPMAVALACGVLFATVISLVLVPASYVIIEDVERLFRWLYGSLSIAPNREPSEVSMVEAVSASGSNGPVPPRYDGSTKAGTAASGKSVELE